MYITTQGLVLRESVYKESDKILTVLTAEGGRRTVKAQGCRKKGSALAAASPHDGAHDSGRLRIARGRGQPAAHLVGHDAVCVP